MQKDSEVYSKAARERQDDRTVDNRELQKN